MQIFFQAILQLCCNGAYLPLWTGWSSSAGCCSLPGSNVRTGGHNNETVNLLIKTIEWFIVLLNHITDLGYDYPCRWYQCRGRQSLSVTQDGGLIIATRHKLATWPRSELGRRRCTSAIAESRKPSLSHGRSGRYGEGGKFSRVGRPGDRTAGGEVVRNA